MAVIAAGQVLRVYVNDAPDRTALYKVSKVTTGDTLDIGPTGVSTDFQTVKQAIILATTTTLAFTCAISGTVLTMPAGLASDAGYLLVWGDTN